MSKGLGHVALQLRSVFLDESADFFSTTMLCQRIYGITDVEKRDVHGNSALHYLAGCRDFNDELMNWWIEQQGVERVWREGGGVGVSEILCK